MIKSHAARCARHGLPTFFLCFLFAQAVAATSAGTAPDPAPGSTSEEKVPIDVFTAPRVKSLVRPDCESDVPVHMKREACDTLGEGTEGWVTLGFMVDPHGKPFEVTVLGSTGNKDFEQLAKGAIERSTFEPGTLNGKAVESRLEFRFVFVNDTLARSPGATTEYIVAYEAAMRAINSGDRRRADQAMHELHATNLYEFAHSGLAEYNYARKWGDESQQISALLRATDWGGIAKLLPAAQFRSAMFALIGLELRTHRYAEALETWGRLKGAKLDWGLADQMKPVIDELDKLRADDTAYEVTGAMPDGSWHLHLFKRHFHAVVSEGHISQVKLRCDRGYLVFAFDPTLDYGVASHSGDCALELDGAPGTQFKLVQD